MRIKLHFLLLLIATTVSAQETKMRDVFAAAPDSIFPILTKNNRLDCIDFIENNMQARVKNRFNGNSELTALTADYLHIQLSNVSEVELKMLTRPEKGDTVLCMVSTFKAPAADSDVQFFDLRWHPLPITVTRPEADAFLSENTDIDIRNFLRGFTLIQFSLSPTEPTLTMGLQTNELTKKQRQAVEGQVTPLVMQWDGKAFVRK
ncbi:MAG: DUF3256 family protein [Bacteroidaceae bacterium]|nr:DUF3256 family protein [Bacteroidaceae bacterium]